MNCNFFEDNIDAFLDKELPEKKYLEIEQHLKECLHCKKKYDGYKKSNTIMRNIFKNTHPPKTLKKTIFQNKLNKK